MAQSPMPSFMQYPMTITFPNPPPEEELWFKERYNVIITWKDGYNSNIDFVAIVEKDNAFILYVNDVIKDQLYINKAEIRQLERKFVEVVKDWNEWRKSKTQINYS